MFLSVSFLLSSIFRSIPTIPTARIFPVYTIMMDRKTQVFKNTVSQHVAEILIDNAATQWSETNYTTTTEGRTKPELKTCELSCGDRQKNLNDYCAYKIFLPGVQGFF